MSTPSVLKKQEIQQIEIQNAEGILEPIVILEETPEWLTKDYLESCLKTYYNDDHVEIKRVHAFPALGKGENYGGLLWRVKIDFLTQDQLQNGHYIIKASFEGDEFSRKAMEPYDIFNREMSIYENILPKLKNMLLEIGDNEEIFVDTVSVDKKRSALIFEDLNARDFKMPSRLEGLNMKLTKIVLRKIAKMHATSAVLNERENGILEIYDRGMFNRRTEVYKPAFQGLFDAGTEMVDEWENYEIYAKKLKDIKPMYMELCKRVFDITPGHINVLAHGDLWTNNVLVKYDNATGDPLDVIIIDFQYAAWGSPAIDLHYLFNTSLQEKMHIENHFELIQYYYTIFSDTLRKLQYMAPIPSLHKFHLQMEEKEFYAFSSTFVVLPVQRNEFTEDADFQALMKEDERAKRFKRTCFKNAYCQKIIRKMLPVFEQRGLLEADQ